MGRKWKKRIDGAISLMLVAILLPSMLLSGLMVDLSRYSMAKALISSAGDLTLNAALADYDGILQDVYGLFAVSQNDEDLYNNLSDYFETTLVSNGVVTEGESEDYVRTMLDGVAQYLFIGESGEANIVNLFDMDIKTDSAVSGVEDSTLENPVIMKKQIVEYMKYRAPVDCALSFFSGLEALGKSNKQAEVIESKLEAETYTQTINDSAQALYQAIQQYDKDLYESKTFSAEYNDPRGVEEKEENDTEGLKDLANAERTECTYNYRLVNQYILGFLLDTEQEDITGGGNRVNLSSGESYIKQYVKRDENVEEAGAALIEAAGAYQNKCFALSDDENYQGIKELVERIVIDTATTELAVKDEVRSYPDRAMTQYKLCFTFLKDTNKEDSAYRAMLETFQEMLVSKDSFDKTFRDVMDIKKSLNRQSERLATRIQICNNNIDSANEKIADNERKIEIDRQQLEHLRNAPRRLPSDRRRAEAEEYNYSNRILELQQEIEECKDKIEEEQGKIEQLTPEKEAIDNRCSRLEKDIVDMKDALAKEGIQYDEASESFFASTIQTDVEGIIDGVYGIYQKYTWYRNEAREYAGLLVKGIYAESSYIHSKSKTMHDDAVAISQKIDALTRNVDTYGEKLDKWERANAEYTGENISGEEDQFGSSNTEEINTSRKSYDKDQIEELKKFNQEQLANIIPFLNYMENANSDGYRYGSEPLWKIDELRAAINAVRDLSGSFVDKDSVTPEECNTHFAVLCKEIPYGYNYAETTTLMKSYTREEEMLPFVGYLKCTYPSSEDEQKETTTVTVKGDDGESEEAKNAKDMYNTMKDSLKNDGKETSDPNADKYGYTYKGKTTPGQGGDAPEANATVDTDDAKNAYSAKKDEAGKGLSGLSRALQTGRDNIYVMEYIFGNFSYNTMVQDATYNAYVKRGGNKADFYARALAGAEDYEPYKALTAEAKAQGQEDPHSATRPTTLSGYPIAEYNNKFYGAEVEYLLYGFQSAENNVTSADASIFAIRFIMNSIYAFSNSEIRNTTRAAGMAVQAASLGTIPYQAVMVVLQLALAMSESLLDISVMHTGAKVAVVPTKKTWMLSPSGAGELLKDVAAAKVDEVVSDTVETAIDKVSTGIQDFVDSSAEEITEKSRNLITGLQSSVEAKATELMDEAFAQVEETLMSELNQMRYLESDQSPQEAMDNAIEAARSSKEEALNSMRNAGGDVGGLIAEAISKALDDVLAESQQQANAKLGELMGENAGMSPNAYVTTLCNMLQSSISELISKKLDEIAEQVQNQVTGMTNSVSGEIAALASQKSEEAKEKIIQKVNGFIDEKVNTITDKMPDLSGLSSENQIVSGGGSAAAAIAFGYSDYLRVFLFLGLCANDKAILERTAKLIECNINYPNTRMEELAEESGEGGNWFQETFQRISWFFTKKGKDGEESSGEWKVDKTYTYVQVDADIEMKMFFLNTEFFTNLINLAYLEEGESAPDTSATVTTYHYHSVMGY